MYCLQKTLNVEQKKVLLWGGKKREEENSPLPMKTGFCYILLATVQSKYFAYYYFLKAHGTLAAKHPGGICMHKPK